MNSAIKLIHISKEYILHHEKPTLVERFVSGKEEKFIALSHINLTIPKGERVGIVGANGSGKTTLLKVITGITKPTTGIRKTSGRLISLIDLDAGFQEDLTGEQNIYLNGMLLGMKKNEIHRRMESIIEYADIKQFIDAPLYTYSQGMKLRLGVSIAINTDPDILIFDEGLGVGDKQFNERLMHTLKTSFKDKTIIIATHDLGLIKYQCDRVLVMEHGKILHDGGPQTLKMYAT